MPFFVLRGSERDGLDRLCVYSVQHVYKKEDIFAANTIFEFPFSSTFSLASHFHIADDADENGESSASLEVIF